MIDVEHWAEIRRMHFVDRVSIREIHRRTGLHRETIRRALSTDRPPAYPRRAKATSKLDPFKEEIERLLRSDHRMPGTRIRELIGELGYEGGKTILDERRRDDSMLHALASAPVDDEPTSPEEDASAADALASYRRGEAISSEEMRRELD